MKKKDFLSGSIFKIEGADSVYYYDGRCLKVRKGDYFEFVSAQLEISSIGFNVESKFINRPISTYILFKNCTIIKP